MKSFFVFIFEIVKIVIIALLIVVPIRYFLFQPFFVRGDSMEPNFSSNDYLIVDQLSYRFRDPQRGEVVVFKYPNDPSLRYIKRIIGLPGETIEIGNGAITIYSHDEEQGRVLDESDYLYFHLGTSGESRTTLGQDEYFIMGDNRPASSDSRRWGPLPRGHIVGRVFIRAWPPTALAKIETPVYQNE